MRLGLGLSIWCIVELWNCGIGIGKGVLLENECGMSTLWNW